LEKSLFKFREFGYRAANVAGRHRIERDLDDVTPGYVILPIRSGSFSSSIHPDLSAEFPHFGRSMRGRAICLGR
jgi:hypothetical protein